MQAIFDGFFTEWLTMAAMGMMAFTIGLLMLCSVAGLLARSGKGFQRITADANRTMRKNTLYR